MSLTRWDPLREVLNIRREMDRLFDEFFGRRRLPTAVSMIEAGAWTPRVDMFDREKELVVQAELPGVGRENIRISATDDTLTIRGEVRQGEEIKEEQYYCCERSYGTFSRTLSLPVKVQADKVQAAYKDGILEVVLPKVEEVVPKEVEVRVE